MKYDFKHFMLVNIMLLNINEIRLNPISLI